MLTFENKIQMSRKAIFYPETTTGCDILLIFPRLQRFLADFRDLTSWVTEMKALINADELANDVAGAEALLDRHQEHKVRVQDFLQLKEGIIV